MRSRVSVNNADAYVAACRAGLGLIQAPHYHVAAGLADGSLRQVLGEWLPPSLPLHAVYPSQRQLSPRVRVFVDWLVELIGSLGLSSRDVRPSSGCPLPPGRIHSNKNKDR